MSATHLGERDAQLYREYAVGLVGYEEALARAESPFRLRRALLEFDQNARQRAEAIRTAPPRA